MPYTYFYSRAPALLWRHNGRDGVSNHQPRYYLLNCSFRRRSKKTSKLRVTGLCAGNSPVTGEFPAQRASNAENVSIWWRYHVYKWTSYRKISWSLEAARLFVWIIASLEAMVFVGCIIIMSIAQKVNRALWTLTNVWRKWKQHVLKNKESFQYTFMLVYEGMIVWMDQ